MKKFRFKFDKLLMIREQAEMEAKMRYAKVLQERVNLDQENVGMGHSIGQMMHADSGAVAGSVLDTNALRFQDQYIHSLEAKIAINNRKKANMKDRLDELHGELTEAMKDKKVIEKLKEKNFEEYKKEYLKHETKVLDEVSGQMYNRKHREMKKKKRDEDDR